MYFLAPECCPLGISTMKIEVRLIPTTSTDRKERVASLRRLLMGGARQLVSQTECRSPEEQEHTSTMIFPHAIGEHNGTT